MFSSSCWAEHHRTTPKRILCRTGLWTLCPDHFCGLMFLIQCLERKVVHLQIRLVCKTSSSCIAPGEPSHTRLHVAELPELFQRVVFSALKRREQAKDHSSPDRERQLRQGPRLLEAPGHLATEESCAQEKRRSAPRRPVHEVPGTLVQGFHRHQGDSRRTGL